MKLIFYLTQYIYPNYPSKFQNLLNNFKYCHKVGYYTLNKL